MTIEYSEPAATTERVPGRSWTVRITGHGDRTASVSCTTSACRMPPRSRDLAALRAFAARHAAAHAKAATVRANAACACRAQGCAAHEGARTLCSGGVLMVLRHDATVGRVWTVEEVCEACAPLLPHATVLARATRPRPGRAPDRRPAPVGGQTQRTASVPAPAQGQAPAPAEVPGGFSAPPVPVAAGFAAPTTPGPGGDGQARPGRGRARSGRRGRSGHRRTGRRR